MATAHLGASNHTWRSTIPPTAPIQTTHRMTSRAQPGESEAGHRGVGPGDGDEDGRVVGSAHAPAGGRGPGDAVEGGAHPEQQGDRDHVDGQGEGGAGARRLGDERGPATRTTTRPTRWNQPRRAGLVPAGASAPSGFAPRVVAVGTTAERRLDSVGAARRRPRGQSSAAPRRPIPGARAQRRGSPISMRAGRPGGHEGLVVGLVGVGVGGGEQHDGRSKGRDAEVGGEATASPVRAWARASAPRRRRRSR